MADQTPEKELVHSCSFFIAFLSVTASMYIGENFTNFTPEDLLVFNLVVVPFAYGVLMGMAPNRVLFFFIALGTIVAIGSRTYSIAGSASDELFNRDLGMALAWAVLGFYSGTLCSKYANTAGVPAYLFAYSVTLIGVSISSIVTEGLIPYLLGDISIVVKQNFGAYFGSMLLGLFLLSVIGPFIARQGINSTLRQFLKIISVFGLLDFIIFYLRDEYISSVLWWISEVPKPPVYEYIFTMAMAGVAVARTTDPKVKAVSPWKINQVGSLIAEDGWGDLSETLPAQVPQETPHIQWTGPNWWDAYQEYRKGDYYKLAAQSSHPCQIAFEFLVIPYPEPVENREDLRTISLLNIKSSGDSSDITISRDGFIKRDSVSAHWCMYLNRHRGVAYFEWCASHDLAIVAQCWALNRAELMNTVPKVREFMEKLIFPTDWGQ